MPLLDFANSKVISLDFIGLILGKKLGEGMSREVYICSIDPTLVIKIESEKGSFQNIREWQIWEEVRDMKIARWFAPCVAISGCGTVLIQKRVELPLKRQYPKKIPSCFVDTKRNNYGMLNNKFVAMDYGTWPTSNGFNNRLKNANWWYEE